MLNIFPLVVTLEFPEHPAEHGINFDVFVADHVHTNEVIEGRFALSRLAKGTARLTDKCTVATAILEGQGVDVEFDLLSGKKYTGERFGLIRKGVNQRY